MHLTQTMAPRLNIAEQTPAVVPIHLERAPPVASAGRSPATGEHFARNVRHQLGITVEDVRRQECRTTDCLLACCTSGPKC